MKKFKKLWSFILTAVLVFSSISVFNTFAADTTLTVNSTATEVTIGDTITVSVDLTGNIGFGALQYTLNYDPALVKYESYELNSAWGSNLIPIATDNGTYVDSLISVMNVSNLEGDGTIYTYTFTALAAGTVDFTLTMKTFNDASTYASIDCSLVGTSVKISAPSMEGVSVTNYSGTYDGNAHSLNVSIPEGAAIAYGTTEGNYSLTSVSYTDAGTYPVYYQVTMDGYETVTGSASIIISQKAVTSDLISDISDVVYTGSQIIPTVTVSDGTPGIITENDYDLSYGSNVNVTDGGTVTITGKGNYTGTAVKTFNIKKATLTASAENLTITYGDAINLTINYTGFVGTDTADVIKTQATAASLGSTPSAGTHSIVLSGAEADNYDFTYAEGAVLTVNKKSVSITSLGVNTKEYDGTTTGTIDTSSIVFDGVLSGDDLSITADSVVFASADVGENIAVSVTGIVLSGSAAANYELLTTSFDTVGTITEKITTTTTTTTATTTTESTTEATTTTITTTTTTESTTETTTSTETTTVKKSSSGGGGGGSSYSVSDTTSTATTTEADTEETTEETTEAETEATTEKAVDSSIKVSIGSKIVSIGEEEYEMEAAPYIQPESSSTLVPLRFVALAILGGDVEDADTSDIISWDSASKTASITVGSDVITFTAGSEFMTINGVATEMSNGVKAEITDGRMYIPFRALGEALGVSVDWDNTTKTASYSAF